MSFDPYESSVEDGQPVELYTFVIGAATYRYTSDQKDISVDTFGDFTAIPISRGKITASREKNGDLVEVRLPVSTPIALNYVLSVPGERVFLTIRRMHRPDVDQEAIVIFDGSVQQVRFEDNRTVAALSVASLAASENRQMPRLAFSGLCGHMLYDARCQIDETDGAFRFTGSVSIVSGALITVPGAGAFNALPDFFEFGYVKFGTDFRPIIKQSVDVLTLQLPFTLSPLGQSVIVNAGCKHRLVTDCQDKFANVENFGGFPFVPLRNPFGPGGI
jgi:uncharacterized phage protein (TIGR02218 family)